MKYSINIDQINSLAWGLNLSEAAVFTYLFHVPTWADPVLINGKTFYFAARQKTCRDVPLISDKPDTIYRIYKSLHEKGVICYLKWMGKDCMRITEKGKGWNSEKNPSIAIELGKKSESTRKIFRKDSEINPTYNSTIDNHTILLDKESVELHSTVTLIDEVDETSVEIHHVPEWFQNDYEKEMQRLQKEYDQLPKIDTNEAFEKLKQIDAELKASKTTQKKERKSSAKKKETTAEEMDLVFQVVQYLNEKTEQSFQPGGEKTKLLILARHHGDKWNLEDFKTVIDHKKSEWFPKDNLRQYLRPSTLFAAGHAEEYLQAAKLWKKKPVATSPGVVPLFRQEEYRNTDRSKFKF